MVADDYKLFLYKRALDDEWAKEQKHPIWVMERPGVDVRTAKVMCDCFPGLLRVPLTANGDTVLHVAAGAGCTSFARELVNSRHMAPEYLEITNSDGNTAFCVAAATGNGDCFQCMVKKNEKLPLIAGQNGMLPIHLATLNGHQETVHELLSSKEMDLLQRMTYNDTERLFFMTITSGMYDVAKVLFAKYPDRLAIARDDEWVKALHMLPARRPSREFHIDRVPIRLDDELEFLKTVWSHVRRLEYKETSELINLTSPALFEAVKSGRVDALKWFLSMNPELPSLKDRDGWSLLHFAVKYRHQDIVNFILQQQRTIELILRALDNDGNNVLHSAALYEAEEASSRMNTRMERELLWFKEMEKRVPRELRTMRNNRGQTPKDLFHANHKELSKEHKEAANGIANSGMLVAALIATIAFAAALTVPGDKNNAWFVVFVLTNAVALFTSSASIISFLSIFTSSWFTENEFIISLSLVNLGLGLLIISIVAMVISFAAASFLIFGHIFKWVAYVVASMGVLPVLLLLVLQSNYVDCLVNYFFWSRY